MAGPDGISALGGVLLLTSSAFFLLVLLATVLAGRPTGDTGLELAEPLEGFPRQRTVFDQLGPWVVVAIALVVIAYAYPLAHHLGMERFGSPGFKPF